MRSISGMPSDDLAGDALRRVPIHCGGRQMRSISYLNSGGVPKRLKGLASNTSRSVVPARGFKSPLLRSKT